MFLSTPPSRVATTATITSLNESGRFYPRHPRGWRQGLRLSTVLGTAFLSTPPSRVATPLDLSKYGPTTKFLSTPPSRVATLQGLRLSTVLGTGFYPRHPRGWRQLRRTLPGGRGRVSIHATLAGGDSSATEEIWQTRTFLSTPPSRVATLLESAGFMWEVGFYPRHPRGWRRRICRPWPCRLRFYPRHPRGWRR